MWPGCADFASLGLKICASILISSFSTVAVVLGQIRYVLVLFCLYGFNTRLPLCNLGD